MGFFEPVILSIIRRPTQVTFSLQTEVSTRYSDLTCIWLHVNLLSSITQTESHPKIMRKALKGKFERTENITHRK